MSRQGVRQSGLSLVEMMLGLALMTVVSLALGGATVVGYRTFTAEARQICLDGLAHGDRPNLQMAMLKKLLADRIRTARRTNIVQARQFSDLLDGAIRRYTNRTLTTAEVIAELVKLARWSTLSVLSPSRRSKVGRPRVSSSCRRRRAKARVISFSASWSVSEAPRSSPPWLGSTTAK